MAENQPAILASRLATEVSSLQSLTGVQLGFIVEGVTTIIASVGLTFAYDWCLALLCMAFFPAVALAAVFQVI